MRPELPDRPAARHALRSAPSRRHAAFAAILCWAGFALCAWLVVTGRTGGFDRWGLLSYRTADTLSFGGPERVFEMVRDVTALGGILLRNLFAAGAIAALLFMRLRREAIILGATVVTGWIANGAMKLLFGRERPEIVPHLTEAGGGSFPSGHSFGAAVVYIAMALAFAALAKRRAVRRTILLCAALVSAGVAWSRVLLGVHYPSDVVAGWLAGAGWALAAYAMFDRSAAALDQKVSHVPAGNFAEKRSPTRGS